MPDLDDLPRPSSGVPDSVLVCSVSGLRVGSRCPPQAARLRSLLGGCDQMGDKNRAGPGQRPAGSLRPLRRWRHRHQRNAGGLWLRKEAVIRLLWSTTA